MQASTAGIDSASAVSRTHRLRQSAATRMRTRAACDLDRDNPVAPEIERQLLVQAFDERRAVQVQEREETDRALLRVAAGEGERARVDELAPECFVAPLRGLNHLA